MLIQFVRAVLTVYNAVIHPLRVTGKEHLPKGQGYILAMNHTSFRDAVTAFLILPNNARYMAKKELFDIPPLRWLITKAGAFPVDRDGTDLTAMRTALGALKEQLPLVIFPEGHRYTDGQIHEFKTGVSFIALRAGVPIVPARIRTSYRPFAKVQVTIGAPLPPCGQPNSENIAAHTQKLRSIFDQL